MKPQLILSGLSAIIEQIDKELSTWERRWWEYKMMKDPVTHEFFKNKGIELISYRELIEMRKNGK